MSRTTVVIPDDILEDVRRVAGEGSVSGFVREAVKDRLERFKRQALLADMDVGYRAEAEQPSLDPGWQVTDREGW